MTKGLKLINNNLFKNRQSKKRAFEFFKTLFAAFVFVRLVGFSLNANEIFINTQDGELFVLDVDPSEKLGDLNRKIAALTAGRESDVLLNCSNRREIKEFYNKQVRTQGHYLGHPRHYFSELKSHEKEDIRFILQSLSNKTLISLAFIKSDLEAAGHRIDHLHPLRFLMTVFSDEELKTCIRNIRARAWVWNHFIGGLKDSLTTESSIGNIKVEHVLHFSEQLNISPDLVSDSIFTQTWDEFVDLLITQIPRLGDHDRYDN